jgi:hypothetical protein
MQHGSERQRGEYGSLTIFNVFPYDSLRPENLTRESTSTICGWAVTEDFVQKLRVLTSQKLSGDSAAPEI